MVRHIDAIFSQGALKPLEPLSLPEGTRVHLRVDDETSADTAPRIPRIRTPKLANAEDAADFVMAVREIDDARV